MPIKRPTKEQAKRWLKRHPRRAFRSSHPYLCPLAGVYNHLNACERTAVGSKTIVVGERNLEPRAWEALFTQEVDRRFLTRVTGAQAAELL